MVLIAPALAFLLSWWLTRLARRYALYRGMIDRPNDRSSHVVPTPRGGGVAIVLVFLCLSLGLRYFEGLSRDFLFAVAGGGGVALVGFLDDRRHVPAAWRLLIHFCAASWVLVWLGELPLPTLGGKTYVATAWGEGLALLFVVWLINLYNFMDGIDGLAGIEAVSVSLGAFVILWVTGDGRENGLALLVLAGAAFGFLCWNWPPAKIFMGDVGSGFLGFVLGGFALHVPTQSSMSFWSWWILLGVFLVDATVTLLVRAARRERLHLAHRSHAYQRLARKFRNHRTVTLGVLGINTVWLFPLALAATRYPAHGAWLAALAMVPLVVLCFWAGAGKKA